MGEPVGAPIDNEVWKIAQEEGRRQHISASEVIRRRLVGERTPQDAIREGLAARASEPATSPVIQMMRNQLEMEEMARAKRAMGRDRDYDSREQDERLERILERLVPRAQPPAAPTTPPDPFDDMQRRMTQIAMMRMMMQSSGMGGDNPMSQALDRIQADLTAKLAGQEASVKGLQDTLLKREAEAREARLDQMFESLQAQMQDLQTRVNTPPPAPQHIDPGDQLRQTVKYVTDAQAALNSLRGAFPQQPGAPAPQGVDLDTISKGLDVAADFTGKMLTATGQYQAIRDGRAPAAVYDPNTGPQPPVGPAYAAAPPADGGGPPPGAAPPPQQQPPPSPGAPGPVQDFGQDAVFLDAESGARISEAEWRQRYGAEAAAHPEMVRVQEAPPAQSAFGPVNRRQGVPSALSRGP